MNCRECVKEIPEGTLLCPHCGAAQRRVVDSEDGFKDTFAGKDSFSQGSRLMDRYEIVCELGRGGMGVVYQAIDHVREADIALKTVPAQLRSDLRAVRMLKGEVNTALSLTHEHICRVHDFQECPEAAFITMELIDGHSLDELLLRQEEKGKMGFPLDWVLRCLKSVCAALDYAHKKGIVHRDLKPGNVMVARDGTVKLTDFGLARAIRTSMSKYSREAASGTLLYMSPEQCLGKPTDARSDVYSLGMMTYELITGEAPFAQAADITYCQLHKDVQPIPELSDHQNAALLQACAKNLNERHASIDTFFAALSFSAFQETGKGGTEEDQSAITQRETASGQVVRLLKLETGVSLDFVWIAPGEFTMGCEDGDEEERPVHNVRIKMGFWMGKYPVTQAQWQAVMGNNPSHFRGNEHLPVENVTWNDCQEFLETIRQQTGVSVRLPTEAEWEYACRAGTSTAYHFGNDVSRLGDYAWFNKNSGLVLSFKRKTHPVGEKMPNAWGIHDMHGGIWEWCEDWFEPDYYVSCDLDDPLNARVAKKRVLRGGSWDDSAKNCRSACRGRIEPLFADSHGGFRVVCASLT